MWDFIFDDDADKIFLAKKDDKNFDMQLVKNISISVDHGINVKTSNGKTIQLKKWNI